MNEFGTKLKKLREDKGMTQQEIADAFYVTAATVSRWESGNRYPDLMTAKKLADYYGVSLDHVLDENEFPEYVKKAPVMENATEGRIQTALYTIAAAGLLLRLIGYFMFPHENDSSFGARAMEVINIFMTGGTVCMTVSGMILSLKSELNPKVTGMIASFFFLAGTLKGIFMDPHPVNMILMAGIPLVCLVLVIRFFFQERQNCYHALQTIIAGYLFLYLLSALFEAESYSYASVSALTRFRFLWSFVQPFGVCCLMALFMWQVHSVYRKRKLAVGGE